MSDERVSLPQTFTPAPPFAVTFPCECSAAKLVRDEPGNETLRISSLSWKAARPGSCMRSERRQRGCCLECRSRLARGNSLLTAPCEERHSAALQGVEVNRQCFLRGNYSGARGKGSQFLWLARLHFRNLCVSEACERLRSLGRFLEGTFHLEM